VVIPQIIAQVLRLGYGLPHTAVESTALRLEFLSIARFRPRRAPRTPVIPGWRCPAATPSNATPGRGPRSSDQRWTWVPAESQQRLTTPAPYRGARSQTPHPRPASVHHEASDGESNSRRRSISLGDGSAAAQVSALIARS
jgi:hypothetical protein